MVLIKYFEAGGGGGGAKHLALLLDGRLLGSQNISISIDPNDFNQMSVKYEVLSHCVICFILKFIHIGQNSFTNYLSHLFGSNLSHLTKILSISPPPRLTKVGTGLEIPKDQLNLHFFLIVLS